ncbi:hypothetical protein DFP72DRAFT_861141 [Ephemerocybe angulata]|uniref:Uncharacterized protein n=1 Tax=Ephemerocybe angulata TaxID=980116 RepID=A0A8H6H7X1_9AGAR|nr:hypothetical protein DFP72DRAFT_861141 [Tulosesus angulatus]
MNGVSQMNHTKGNSTTLGPASFYEAIQNKASAKASECGRGQPFIIATKVRKGGTSTNSHICSLLANPQTYTPDDNGCCYIMSCNGSQKSGKQCKCTGYKKHSRDSRCECKHIQDGHMKPKVQDILRQFVARGTKSAPPPNPAFANPAGAAAAARMETNSSFHPAKSRSSAAGGGSMQENKVQKQRFSKVGKITFISGGMKSTTQTSSWTKQHYYQGRSRNIVASAFSSSLRTVNPSSLGSTGAMLKLFPKLFQWLECFRESDLQSGEYFWCLIGKDNWKLYVIQQPELTGDNLFVARESSSCSWRELELQIVFNQEIPKVIYKDWDSALQNLSPNKPATSEDSYECPLDNEVENKEGPNKDPPGQHDPNNLAGDDDEPGPASSDSDAHGAPFYCLRRTRSGNKAKACSASAHDAADQELSGGESDSSIPPGFSLTDFALGRGFSATARTHMAPGTHVQLGTPLRYLLSMVD